MPSNLGICSLGYIYWSVVALHCSVGLCYAAEYMFTYTLRSQLPVCVHTPLRSQLPVCVYIHPSDPNLHCGYIHSPQIPAYTVCTYTPVRSQLPVSVYIHPPQIPASSVCTYTPQIPASSVCTYTPLRSQLPVSVYIHPSDPSLHCVYIHPSDPSLQCVRSTLLFPSRAGRPVPVSTSTPVATCDLLMGTPGFFPPQTRWP